jgi:hypothetical protein
VYVLRLSRWIYGPFLTSKSSGVKSLASSARTFKLLESSKIRHREKYRETSTMTFLGTTRWWLLGKILEIERIDCVTWVGSRRSWALRKLSRRKSCQFCSKIPVSSRGMVEQLHQVPARWFIPTLPIHLKFREIAKSEGSGVAELPRRGTAGRSFGSE